MNATRLKAPRCAHSLWIYCVLILGTATGAAWGATATIADAWWLNQQDADGDGCVSGTTGQVARLAWDANAGPGETLTVFERIYYRPCGASAWTFFGFTPNRVITDTATDAIAVDIPLDPDCNCYEYQIEVYRSGQATPDYARGPTNDPDLSTHREEFTSQDVSLLTATIRNAFWTNQQDTDGDGCVAGTGMGGTARLNFIPDVAGGNGTLTVFEKVYYRPCSSGAWTLYGTSSPHGVTGSNSLVAHFIDLPMDPGCACFDYRIEIYRNGMATPDAFRDSSNDLDLALHQEETAAQDAAQAPTATVRDAWWSNQRDWDGDGCFAGTGPGETARLHWDPDVTTNASLVVFERIYFKPCASNGWYLYATNAAHTITNNDSGDSQFVDILMDANCNCYDYQVVIFRLGVATQDVARGPGEDSDLFQHREEGLTGDLASRIRVEPLTLGVNCDSPGPPAPPAFVPAAGAGADAIASLQPRKPRTKPTQTTVGDRFEQHVITVKFKEGLIVRARNDTLTRLGPAELGSAGPVLASLGGARWRQAYSLPEDTLEQLRQTAQKQLGREVADLNLQLNLFLAPDQNPASVIDALNSLEVVELAQPIPKPVRPPLPPNLEPLQAYLTAPPDGINAVGAWPLGARGAGIRIADIEYSFGTHQDLPPIGLVGHPPAVPPGLGPDVAEHGTAVLGQLAALDNEWGVTGIAPQASLFFSGTWSGTFWDVGEAILAALAALRPGDIMLIEQQTSGPNYPCSPDDNCGLVPVEWYAPWYHAIVTAVGNGVTVVEAAGNGYQNLDGAGYVTGNGGHWPFLDGNDSGAILVGAGSAPPSAGGSSVVRSRLDYSNYGSTVDLQGWGERIWTTGYGNLLGLPAWNEPGREYDYTGLFGGTSGASPIVTGACALLQSAYKARTSQVLSPQELKQVLRTTGSPQQAGLFPATQHIGPMPDVHTAIMQIVPPPAGDTFRIYNDGAGTLSVSGITTDQPAPWLTWNPQTPFTVAPGSYVTVTFAVDCARAPGGPSTRRLLISSSDPEPTRNPYPGGVFITVTNSMPTMPTLQIRPAAPNFIISWTPAAPGFVLQESSGLSPSNWSNAPSGSTNPVTLSPDLVRNFYRLRRP